MKVLLTLSMLAISAKAFSTEWLTYYVYFETGYSQGPWTRTDMLEASNRNYLAVEVYEDLFGSVDEDLIGKLISRLKDKKPALYNWTYDLEVQGDTVVITPKGQLKNRETVKNELTATLTFNSFNAVTFDFGDSSETWTKDDLTLPYFDLISKQPIATATDTTVVKQDRVNAQIVETGKSNPLKVWLIISVIVNIGLVSVLVLRKGKN